jgi:hypothetical protein
VVPAYNADEAGGMDYPPFFTVSSHDTVEKGTLQRYFLDFVTIHEFGHGYFYGILASNEFEEPMLDEGLNEFWNHRMNVANGEHAQANTWLTRAIGADIGMGEFQSQRIGAMLSEPADPLGNNAWHRYSSGSYGTIYSRTATMLHDLERQVGKAAMARAFKLYYARWKFRHPSIADFREALADGTGQRALVERMFADHVYGARKVDDRIVEFDSEEALPSPGLVEYRGKPVEITEAQLEKAVHTVRDRWKKAHPDAKLAVTHYRTIETKRGYSMLEIRLETGRKNQIRTHLSEAGHPVIGDRLYGSVVNPIGRLGLHAKLLGFQHPRSGKRLEFTAPVPAGFKKLFGGDR